MSATGLGGECRVAAGEDEAKPVVGHWPHLLGMPGSSLHRVRAPPLPRNSRACLAAQAVDGAWLRAVVVIQPPGLGGTPSARPLAQGDGERLLDRILGDVDVAEGADQGGDRSAGLLAEDPADLGLVDLGCGVSVALSSRPRCIPCPGFIGEVRKWTDLDRHLDGAGDLGRPDQRGVQVLGLDDVEAAEVLLGLHEGPSVVTSPAAIRTTVAVSGSCRRPEKTQAPAACNSCSRTRICLQDCCISSSVIGSRVSPSTLWTDNKYRGMVLPPVAGRVRSRRSPNYEQASPRLTRDPRKLVGSRRRRPRPAGRRRT